MSPRSSATELVTAATNIPLALTALAAAMRLCQWRREHPLRAGLWIAMFGSLAVASGLGVLAHGLAWEPATLALLWRPLNAALALTVACFGAGAVLDGWGPGAARRWAPGFLTAGAGFYVHATWFAHTFLPFVVYEGLTMLFCLAVYAVLTVKGRPGASWMLAGVAITILAAGLQATRVVTLVPSLPLDHNGVFHLVQVPGLWCLRAGLKNALGSKPPDASYAPQQSLSLQPGP